MAAHFEDHLEALDGKAIVVCLNRRIRIVKLRLNWHSTVDNAGAVKIVMTGAASNNQERQRHICNKARRDPPAKRVRDPKEPAQAGDCARHASDQLRCDLNAHDDVRGQANASPRTEASDCMREPHVPLQARPADRGLHRHCATPEVGTAAVFYERPRKHRRQRSADHYCDDGKTRGRAELCAAATTTSQQRTAPHRSAQR